MERSVSVHAGVSVGTVSNVLNRPARVQVDTRAKVQAAMQSLGYVRNETARQLRAGDSRTVGLVVLDVANPFFTDLARGVEDRFNSEGLAVVLCNTDADAAKERGYLELLAEQRVRGILISPTPAARPLLADLRRRGLPVVLLDRSSGRAGPCSAAVDDVKGGDLALTHLLDAGHRRVTFVGDPGSSTQVRDRLLGARRAVRRFGLASSTLQVALSRESNVVAGRDVAHALIGETTGALPSAVFCANDLLALGVLHELLRHGVDVPGDVALVGYDDIAFAEAAAVPLTSVQQPRHQLGYAAAGLLIEETSPGSAHHHRQIEFAPTLVVRDSTA
jgi:LacI family transcriptional regulator